MGTHRHDRLIITAASESYATALLALLGSLTLNWPGHPSSKSRFSAFHCRSRG